jgi:hypothetical protein
MDLADASLVWLAHEHGRRSGVYQLPGGEGLENLLES